MIHAYVGSWSLSSEDGGDPIAHCHLDPASGALSVVDVADVRAVASICISTSRRSLYAAVHASRFEGVDGGGLVGFSIDPDTGALTRQSAVHGLHPHPNTVAFDRDERCLLVASGLGGALTVVPLAGDGRLEEPSQVIRFDGPAVVPLGTREVPASFPRESPFPHCVVAAPGNRFVLVSDMIQSGIRVHGLDAGHVEEEPVAWVPGHTPAAGVRHLAFSTSGETLFVTNEAGSSVSVFSFDPLSGELELELTVPSIPDDFAGANNAVDIKVHPNGRFVYVSNRGSDLMATYRTSPQFELVGFEPAGGATPRTHWLTPDAGLLLAANQGADAIVAFAADADTGALTPTGEVTELRTPATLAFAELH